MLPTVRSAIGTEVLLRAIESGQRREVRLILRDLAVDPNAADEATGRLPLHAAAESGNVEVLEELLEWDARPDATGPPSGGTALHVSARGGRDDAGSANTAQTTGTAAMDTAATAVGLLLRYGADPNAEDARGRTALWHAAW